MESTRLMPSRLQPIAGLREVAERHRILFVDQFGTMHDGRQAYPRAAEALVRYRQSGGQVVVLSNSAKSGDDNRRRLEKLGFDGRHYDHVVTSGDAARRAILDGRTDQAFAPGARVHVSGKAGDGYGFEHMGFSLVPPDDAEGIILAASQEPDRPWRTQVDELSAAARRRIPVMVCNPDLEMLTPVGVRASAGSIARELARLGARVTTFGKPLPFIYGLAREKLGGVSTADVLAVGDSPEHDLQGALDSGIAAALVRTGIMTGCGDAEIGPRLPGQDAVFFGLDQLAW